MLEFQTVNKTEEEETDTGSDQNVTNGKPKTDSGTTEGVGKIEIIINQKLESKAERKLVEKKLKMQATNRLIEQGINMSGKVVRVRFESVSKAETRRRRLPTDDGARTKVTITLEEAEKPKPKVASNPVTQVSQSEARLVTAKPKDVPTEAASKKPSNSGTSTTSGPKTAVIPNEETDTGSLIN